MKKQPFKKNKNFKKSLAEDYINSLFFILKNSFNSIYEKKYIKEIKNICEKFNLKLNRNQKSKFCKKCYSYFNSKNRRIVLNKNTKCIETICLKCSNIKRIKYKN